MGFIRNISVAQKLACIGVLAFIATLIVGWVGYTSIRAARADMEELYNEDTMSIYYCSQVRYNTRYSQIQASLQPYTNKPEYRQERVTKFNAAIAEAEDFMQKYEALHAKHPKRAEMAAKVRKDFDAYKANAAQLLQMNAYESEDDLAPMMFYQEKVMPLAVAMSGDLEAVQGRSLEDAKKGLDKGEEDMNSAVFRMVVTCAVIIVVLTLAIAFVTKQITGPLQLVIRVCEKLSKGDFRTGGMIGTVERGDEFGRMEAAVRDMRITVNNLIKKVITSTEQLAASSQELTATAHQSALASEQVAQRVTSSAGAVIEQQKDVEEAMESIDNTMNSISNLNQTAGEVTANVTESHKQAQDGSSAIGSAVDKIVSVESIVNSSTATVDKLGQRSQEIGQIVETISGIADQTNLLALNAAIEAARAGEHGRGFAVVADEVRKLAEESQNAAKRITDLIGAIQNDTTDAVNSMQRGNAAVKEGTESVSQLKAAFDKILEASDAVADKAHGMSGDLKVVSDDTENVRNRSSKISENSRRVAADMESVSAAAEEQSAAAEEIASASEALAQLAHGLQTAVGEFKV
ncbi:methyl-accepting chemotaxis protein [Selenomonas ruminantium]|uniref:Methyl-accepting chemotaxis protein n=1 Tax=Selenomonas ruminantium TaxID=971 RepID=A0A1M6R0C8_SELRU|nr:methyl-accepting chemotaxis protein [Selenomonas ruminantium]SHK25955.1 methyl-accepting chemotaxis protein [Selenomonas ruminantium]